MKTEKIRHFLPVAEPDLGPVEERMVLEALRSGWVSSLGSFISRFENEFASFCEVPYGIAVSNGTAALHLALIAAGIGPGDEVIVPALTFVATAAVVRHAGATPVFADCEPEIGTLNPAAVKHAITQNTKAIVAVHLYGHPADMDSLMEIARMKKILLIEDAAEAHGASYKGRKVGSLGHMATFSFYGNKIITTGEGGMVLTKNEALDARLRFLRDHAMDPHRRYWHPEIGFNYRITNLQAALGVAQLSRIDEIITKRVRVLETYRSSGLEQRFGVVFNPQRSWATPVPWLVCAILPSSTKTDVRDQICGQLREQGIDTRPYFIPLHHMPPYSDCRTVATDGSERLVVTEALATRGFNLPSSGNLRAVEIHRVTKALEKSLASTMEDAKARE